MSVILDALRRRRGVESPPDDRSSPSSVRPVPAGLGLTPVASSASSRKQSRVLLMGIMALVVMLIFWVALRLNSTNEMRPSSVPAIAAQPVPLPQPLAPESQAVRPPAIDARAAIAARGRSGSDKRAEPRPSSVALTSPNVELRASNTGFRVPSPTSRPDHFDLALRYQNLGDFERAREHYLAALTEDEFNVEARNNLGLLYHGRGMTSAAIDEFRRAIAVNERYVKARSNLAVALMSAGRLSEARGELREALDVAPRNVDLLVNLALVEKGEQHLERAIELLVRAVGTSPEHAVAHYNLAVLYEEHDSLALAFDHYNAFLKYAGPEHGSRITEVQRRVLVLQSTRQ